MKEHNETTNIHKNQGLLAKTKLLIFRLLYEMLKYHSETYLKRIIFITINLIQLLYFPFQSIFKNLWNDTATYEVISRVSKFSVIYPLLEDSDWILYLIVFYIACFWILLTIAMVTYSQHFNLKFSNSMVWIIKFFCFWISLLVFILYLPIAGILSLIFDCESTSEGLVHSYYHEIHCFTGIYWIHVIVGTLFLVLLVVISSIFSLLFFETKIQPNDISSKTDGRHQFYLVFYKISLIILSIFAKITDCPWLLWLPMLGFSVIMYVNNGTHTIYFSYFEQKISECVLTLSLWISLVFAYVATFEQKDGLSIFIVGALIILFITYIKKKGNWVTALSKSKLNKSKASNHPRNYLLEIFNYSEMVLNSIKDQTKDLLLLNTYIYHHSEVCLKSNCALNQHTREDLKLFEHASKQKECSNTDTQLQGKISNLLSHCNELYLEGLAQFPKSNTLRLFYCLYLIQATNNESSALELLAAVEHSQPSFEEQALIYRLREIVKDKLLASKNNDANNLDVILIMSYETHKNSFKEEIVSIAKLHHEFWCLLIDDIPDLTRFRSLGFMIQDSINELDFHWQNMQDIDPNQPSILSYYAKFSEEILNDKELSNELKAKISYSNMKRTNINKQRLEAINGCQIQTISTEGDPCVCVSGQANKLGIITDFNNSLCRVFGYQRKELIGMNISCLMPELFASVHDEILREKSQQKSSTQIRRRDLQIYGKLKNGCIASMWLNLLALPTVLNESNFIAIIRLDKSMSNFDVAELLLDNSKTVVEVNSKAILIFELDHQLLRQHKINFKDLCPSLATQQINKRITITTHLYFPDFDEQNDEITKTKKHAMMNCSIEPIRIRDKKLIGYSVRLESIPEVISLPLCKEVPDFQFWYDPDLNKYIRTSSVDDRSQNPIQSHFSRSLSYISSLKKGELAHIDKDEEVFKEFCDRISSCTSDYYQTLLRVFKHLLSIQHLTLNSLLDQNLYSLLKKSHADYGKDVMTFRIINGDIKGVDKFSDTFPSVSSVVGADLDDESAKRSSKNKTDYEKSLMTSYSIRGRKSLENALTRTRNIELTWVYIFSYLPLLILFSLAILNYVYLKYFFDLISEKILLVDGGYQRMISEQAAVLNTMELLLTYEYNFLLKHRERYIDYKVFYNMTQDEYYELLRKNLITEANDLHATHKDLIKKTTKLPDYDDYAKIRTNRNVNLNLRINVTNTIKEKFSLSESLYKFVSSLYKMSNKPIISNLSNWKTVTFVLDNGNNAILVALGNSDIFYANKYKEFLDNGQIIVPILLIFAIVFLLIIFVLLTILIIIMESKKMKLYALFLEIPSKSLKLFSDRTEAFLNEINDISTDLKDDDYSTSSSSHNSSSIRSLLYNQLDYHIQRNRNYKNKPKLLKSILLCFFITICVLLSFYISEFSIYTAYRERGFKAIPAFNNVYFLTNRRQYIYKPDSIMWDIPVYDFLLESMNKSFEIIKNLESYDKALDSILDKKSINEIELLLLNNICSHITFFKEIKDCENFAGGLTQQGLVPLITNYLLNIKIAITKYEAYKLIVGVDYDFFNSDILYQCTIVMNHMIRPSFRGLKESFVKGLKNTFKDISQIRLGLLIGYLLLIVIIALFVWRPFLDYMHISDLKSKKMLAILPLELLKNIGHIHEYIKKSVR